MASHINHNSGLTASTRGMQLRSGCCCAKQAAAVPSRTVAKTVTRDTDAEHQELPVGLTLWRHATTALSTLAPDQQVAVRTWKLSLA